MRRCPTAAAAALVVFFLGGCTDSADTDPSARASRTPSTKPTTPRTVAPQPPDLEVPQTARVLVPETSGTADAELPEFTPSEQAYTVYAGCSGNGEVTIVDLTGAGKPHPVACDGVRTVGVIHTPEEAQRLAIRVTGGTATWKISIISGSRHL